MKKVDQEEAGAKSGWGAWMANEFFRGRRSKREQIFLPYRRAVKWLPQIGDVFPDFQVTTTQGPLQFFDWAEGH